MKTDLVYLYQSILESQGIQLLFISDDFQNLPNMDYSFRRKLYQNNPYQKIANKLTEMLQENAVFFLRDALKLDYCFFELPEQIQPDYPAKYILIGPVTFGSLPIAEIRKILLSIQAPSSLASEYVAFYNRLPSLPSCDFWFSLIIPLLKELFSDTIEYKFTEFNLGTNEKYNPEEPPGDIALKVLEDHCYVEEQMLKAVAAGNEKQALEWYHKFIRFKFVSHSSDSVRDYKNILLALNTLLQKAVQSTGIHPYFIDKIASEFNKRIEHCVTEAQLKSLEPTMFREYCQLVLKYVNPAHTELIEKCVQYIKLHYTEALSLDILARHCSVTANYLSAAFKKETGKTVTEYIIETRIEHSMLLLNATNFRIQEIAHQCGFSDANYFCRTFKKVKGITPSAYRKHL